MTSPISGLRRVALATLAAGSLVGLSACGAGQISQTADQQSAVDGGAGKSGDINVDNAQIVLPDNGGNGAVAKTSNASVQFVASYNGYSLNKDDGVKITSVTVAGKPAQLSDSEKFARGCSIVVGPQDAASAGGGNSQASGAPCIKHATANANGDFTIGQPVPIEVSFDNGAKVTAKAAVVVKAPEAGTYTRPGDPKLGADESK